jgi:hypothetical protein
MERSGFNFESGSCTLMKTLLRSSVIFLLFTLNAHSQSFTWAKRAGLWAFDLGHAIGSDASGNVFIAGKYEMNANFGGLTVSCAGNHDIYVAKYNSSGSILWVRTAGGSTGDYAHCLTTDPEGNVYIAGEMEGTVTFTPGVTLTSNGDNDIFVAKYNTNGYLQWAKKVGGGSKSDKALGISYSNGNVYLTGRFDTQGNFSGVTMTAYGGKDVFVAKYSSAGVFQWIKRAGGSGSDEGAAISSDASGNAYVTGWFSGTANFSGITVTSAGSKDAFIAKYSSSGNIIWVKRAGGLYDDFGRGIKTDNSGRVFVTGSFRYKATFSSTTVTATKAADVFVARYDQYGSLQWVKKAGGNYDDEARALALDASSNVIITGDYGFSATFGTKTLTGVDSSEIYFASYDKSGNFRWALGAGGGVDKSPKGTDPEKGLSVATDPYGNVLGSGCYRSSSNFGSTTLSAWENTDIYIVKISQTTMQGRMAVPSLIAGDSASFCTGGSVKLSLSYPDSSARYVWLKNNTLLAEANGPELTVKTAGEYKVMIINGDDTLTSRVTKVSETNKLTAVITSNRTQFCRDSSNILQAPVMDGYLYQWKRNGRIISGANTATLNLQREGNYQVKIMQGSCVDWSQSTNVVFEKCSAADTVTSNEQITGIQEQRDSSIMLKVFPNPNNGKFMLQLHMAPTNDDSKKVVIQLLDLMANSYYYKVMPAGQTYFDEVIELNDGVHTGVYFLKVSIGEMVETTKILLVK